MANTRELLNGISGNLDDSLGVQPSPRRAQLSPVPSKKDVGRRRRHDVGSIDVDLVIPDPEQPRKQFSDEAIARLADSLQSQGQLQPIRVRWSESLGMWVIVSGERRWRAAKLSGMRSIDCVFEARELEQAETLTQQLIENLVREDLLPIEEARAYQQLMQLKGWNGKQVAKTLHVPASKVSRSLALLDLPPEVQQRVAAGELAPRTAYELRKLPDANSQWAVAEQVSIGRLTQKETADAVKRACGKRKGRGKSDGVKAKFWCENGWKVTVSSKGQGNYEHVKEALQQALEETELRVQANIQLV